MGCHENITVEEEIIEKALLKGSGIQGGKERIQEFVLTNPSGKELADMLREEYGIGGWLFPTRQDKQVHGCQYDSRGMKIRWMNGSEEAETFISWNKAARVVKMLVASGKYL